MDKQQITGYIRSLSPAVFGLSNVVSVISEQINGGMHHFNFKVTLSDGSRSVAFVVRMPTSPQDALALHNEQWYIGLAGHVTPEAVYYTRQTPFNLPLLITRFVEGAEYEFAELDNLQIAKLAKIVHHIHTVQRDQFSIGDAMKPEHRGTLLDYTKHAVSELIDKRYQAVAGQVPHDAVVYKKARQLLTQQLQDAGDSWNISTFSLCHGDLGGTNVLWVASEPHLIDWDGANFGDPANEIGYIFAINNLSSPWQQTFLKAYMQQSPLVAVTDRIATHILKNRLADVVWALGKMHEAAVGSALGLTEEQAKQLYEERHINLAHYLNSI